MTKIFNIFSIKYLRVLKDLAIAYSRIMFYKHTNRIHIVYLYGHF